MNIVCTPYGVLEYSESPDTLRCKLRLEKTSELRKWERGLYLRILVLVGNLTLQKVIFRNIPFDHGEI